MAVDPFRNKIPLDESNFLKVVVRHFKDDSHPADFNAAIDVIDQIRDVLQVIQKLGRLPEVGNYTFYMDALRWLHFEMPLSNLVAVPQITTLDSVDPSVANSFKQYCDNLLIQLRSLPIYTAVETSIAASSATISKSARQVAENLVSDKTSELNAAAESTVNDANARMSEQSGALNQTLQGFRDEQTQFLNDARQSITKLTESAISQFQAAQALQRWGDSYDEQIEEYQLRLLGKKWAIGTASRNFNSIKKLYQKHKQAQRTPVNYIFTWLKWNLFFAVECIFLLFKNAVSVASFWRYKLNSYSGRRTFWFSAIVIFIILFVTVSLLSLAEVKTINGFNVSRFTFLHNGQQNNNQLYLKLTVYIPIAIILGIAYSFAIKNFRIYSNMLDQYLHRRNVAYTSQGIILSLTGNENADLRDTVTAAAATALFEQKNTGHLTKNETESLNPLDFLKLLR
jgi:hypothetical protein